MKSLLSKMKRVKVRGVMAILAALAATSLAKGGVLFSAGFNGASLSPGTAVGTTPPTLSNGVLVSPAGDHSATYYDWSGLPSTNIGTIEFWYKPATQDTQNHVIFQVAGSAMNADTPVMTLFRDLNYGGALRLILGGGWDSVDVSTSAGNTWAANTWHHVACVWLTDGGPGSVTIILYADGIKLGEASVTERWWLAAVTHWTRLYLGGTPLIGGTDYRFPTSGDVPNMINAEGQFDNFLYSDYRKYTGDTYVPNPSGPQTTKLFTADFNGTSLSPGTPTGATPPTVSGGVLTSPAGDHSAVSYDWSSLPSTETGTFEFRYKPATQDTQSHVLFQVAGPAVGADTPVMTLCRDSNYGGALRLFLGGGWSLSTISYDAGNSWAADTWHHIACVWENDAMKVTLYADGTKAGEADMDWTLRALSHWTRLYLGGTPLIGGADYRFPTPGDVPNLINAEGQFDNFIYSNYRKYTGDTYVPNVPNTSIYNAPEQIPAGSAAVDGNLNDWAGAAWTSIDQGYNVPIGMDILNQDIPEAYYAAKWQANKVYVAVKVRDTAHYFTDSYTDWNARDAIEVYLHTNGGDPLNYLNATSAQQYTIGIMLSDPTKVWTSIGGNGITVPVPTDGSYDAIVKTAGKVDGQWLYYEIEMTPFTYLGILADGNMTNNVVSPLTLGDQIGLDVCVVGNNNGTYVGMKSENMMAGKFGDWSTFGLHQLAAADPTPTPTPTPIAGDANGDNKVDVSDLGILAANYGTTSGATRQMGDFNNDGKVDVSDLGILAANYGTGTGATLDFNADAKTLGLSVDAKAETPVVSNLGCGSAGLPLVAGLAMTGLILLKLEEQEV